MALLAGQGLYPALAAAAIRRAEAAVRLIALEGETDPELAAGFPDAHRRTILVGQLGKLLQAIRELGAGYVLMAGQVTPRRLFGGFHPDLAALRLLFSLKRRNAETIFGAVAREIESLGVAVLDARAFLDDQLAAPGPMTGRALPIDPDYVRHGVQIARECARLDIGQGCVVRQGTVLAVEAFEGTDEMLRRAGAFKAEDALFVKAVKPRQDFRFDVPCFGLRTLEAMREAGISAAVLEAHRVLILDKPAVLEKARAWGVDLAGFE